MKARNCLFLLTLLFSPAAGFPAHGPDWWYEHGVIVPDPVDDFAAFNQGQLKHMATAAYEELEQLELSTNAWDALTNMVDGWTPAGLDVDDYSLVNLGQLKFVADRFYDVLSEEGIVNETPWAGSPDPADDYALANIGQLKNVFSFDLDDGCWFSKVFAENSNMLVYSYSFIGEREQRGCFHDGSNAGIALLDGQNGKVIRGMDEGYLFSTGEAEYWDVREHEQNASMDREEDTDLQQWMETQGFDWGTPFDDLDSYPKFETDDAAGISIKFEVEFADPEVEDGTIEVPFIFGSDEYYNVSGTIKNDGMAIFLFELDEEDNPLPYTRTNIALLPETETHSRAVNIFNSGEAITRPPSPDELTKANFDQSEFRKNSPWDEHYDDPDSPPPYDFGYTGFTGRLDSGYEGKLIAEGGVLRELEVTSVLKQAKNVSPEVNDAGWGGIIFRGNYLQVSGASNELSGYVVAFGRDSGDDVFTVYKSEGHNDWDRIIPNTSHQDFPSNTVTVLDSIQISNFQLDEWYTVNVSLIGSEITARFWEGNEPTGNPDGIIQVTDSESPLPRGFLGAIHIDEGVYPEPSHLKWDLFDAETFTDFGDEDLSEIPEKWTRIGGWLFEYQVIADAEATGGKVLDYENRNETEHVQVLVWHGREKVDTGVLEAGKRYMLKIVVADTDDPQWDSIVLVEREGIRIVPDE